MDVPDQDLTHWATLNDDPLTDEIISLWKPIDTALSSLGCVHLAVDINISIPLEELPRPFGCQDDLLRALLPTLAAGRKIKLCNGYCDYHQ